MKKPHRPRMQQAVRAGDLVERLLEGLGIDERVHQYRALVVWEKAVGPQIAVRTRPVRIRDGILEVNVDQPTWMQQLQLMKPKILARLNAELGEDAVRDIFLKRGKVTAPAAVVADAPPRWRRVELSGAEREQVTALLSTVTDPDLRRSMESLLLKQARLLKSAE